MVLQILEERRAKSWMKERKTLLINEAVLNHEKLLLGRKLLKNQQDLRKLDLELREL